MSNSQKCNIENPEDMSETCDIAPRHFENLETSELKKPVSAPTSAIDPCVYSRKTLTEPTTQPYKFRPRFADEGLESLYSGSSETDDSDHEIDDVDESYQSADLQECLTVGYEMEEDILRRNSDMREKERVILNSTDFLRE